MRKNLTMSWDTINQYATDLFTNKTVETIKNHDKRDPMFLMLTHLAPHTANENDPMQAPDEEIKKFKYIRDEDRRVYAAMVSKLDESVGQVVKALDDNKMLDNTIILFMSDNGAPVTGMPPIVFCWTHVTMRLQLCNFYSIFFSGEHANSGSNFPFKGVC